ncbi:Mnd1 family protein [Enterocytozoon bieneusi H348]|nr:Mnd1 family protein [Enterocytozoon bieneusi H348]|eukprot:XP_002652482.1 Mnd1 family protein [Enterocytozoon bieneusi H348]
MGKKTSEEEKLKKIVEFFEATSDVYSLKELEKKLPKSCGISGLVVKDLVQTLVSENRINSEKCGSSNLYWRFRYQEHHRLQCETERNTNAIEVLRKENERLLCEVNAIEKSIEDTDERQEL